MPSYKVIRTVVHGEKAHAPGSSLTLTPEQAHPLVAKGYLAVEKPKAPKG